MNPLLGQGYRKSLEIEDLYETLSTDESQLLGDQLERLDIGAQLIGVRRSLMD